MNKKIILLLAALIAIGACAFAAPEDDKSEKQSAPKIDVNTIYYPNATLPGAINKYKSGNFTGSLQESISILEKDPGNAVATYYAGLAFAKIGDKDSAVKYLDKTIDLSRNQSLIGYAQNAKACVNGEDSCKLSDEDQALEKLIRSPFTVTGGFSPEAEAARRQKELDRIKQKINDGKPLTDAEFKKLNNKSKAETTDRLAYASDEDILKAIKTLKEAGVNVTVNAMPQDPQMQQMQMMMGGNNNNNTNAMWNMLPVMFSNAEQSGKNMDPQVMQAIMMQSMMPDFGGFGSNNNNR
jgi:tetratricopeptide (TPR) repeat protein